MSKNENQVEEKTAAVQVQSQSGDVIEHESGEVSKFLYFEGRPREYRFNGQTGQFSLYGDKMLTDKSGRALGSFSFQPIAYRIFEDGMFGRSLRELWAELFFVDDDNCVACIMFNNTSVNELYRLLEPILYERKSLCDVIITCKAEKVVSKSDPGKTWFISRFTYEPAEQNRIIEMRELVTSKRIYRNETISVTATHKLVSQGYYLALDSMNDYTPHSEEKEG